MLAFDSGRHPAGNKQSVGSMKVLIVDDEPSLREVLQLCLERSGYRVRSANCPLAAFSILQEFVPEVIVCDLHLAGMNGIEFCSTVSKLLPRARIFLMTGGAPTAADCAPFTVLYKPLSIKRLMALLGPARCEAVQPGPELATHVEHISGAPKKFILVLKSGPPRFTFMEWYDLGFVTTWTRQIDEAERILERHAHDLLAIDLGRNVAQVREICERIDRFRPPLRIMFLKDPAIPMPHVHCGDVVASNQASRMQLYAMISPQGPLWNSR